MRIAADTDSIGGLNQNWRARTDFTDDLRVDLSVAAVFPQRIARVNVNHRGAGRMAARGRLADFRRLFGDDGTVSILLHSAVDGDGDDDFVAGEHGESLLGGRMPNLPSVAEAVGPLGEGQETPGVKRRTISIGDRWLDS